MSGDSGGQSSIEVEPFTMLVIVNKAEFYATVDLSADDLKELLAEWQHYYNWERPHSAHNGKTPMEHYFELAEKTPYSDAVHANYQPNEEHIQEQNYKLELELRKLKRCL